MSPEYKLDLINKIAGKLSNYGWTCENFDLEKSASIISECAAGHKLVAFLRENASAVREDLKTFE